MTKKMSKDEKATWYRLDLSAIVYPTLQRKNFSSVYRLSVVLKECVEPDLLQKAEDTIRTRLEEVFALLRETGCDLFQLNRSLYRASKAKYEEWKDTLLATVPAEFDIKIKSTK